MLDQPAYTIRCMTTALTVYNAVYSWAMAFYTDGLDRWMRYHKEDWEIVQTWMRLKGWLPNNFS